MFENEGHDESVDGLSGDHDPREIRIAGEEVSRVYVHRPRILVLERQRLDEVTTAVDPDAEDVQQNVLKAQWQFVRTF